MPDQVSISNIKPLIIFALSMVMVNIGIRVYLAEIRMMALTNPKFHYTDTFTHIFKESLDTELDCTLLLDGLARARDTIPLLKYTSSS
jgi:hypothetical protein